MRRVAVLTGAAGAFLLAGLLAGMTWLAAAQFGIRESDSRSVGFTTLPVPAKVDINRAGLEELGRLPGITPELAGRILRNRPYRKLDDLVTRRVLGKKQFARIRELVVVGRASP